MSEVLDTVRLLETQRREPTFNTILEELSSKGALSFHRSLRRYLDVLVLSKLLTVKHQKTVQLNVRPKQVYHTTQNHKRPVIDAGETAFLLHGLNWNILSPRSLNVKIDLQALALARVSGKKVYAAVEDAIVQSLKSFSKNAERSSEIVVFATALLATRKIDIGYLLRRAKEEGVQKKVAAILLAIDKTLTSPAPNVEDVKTLYELRIRYQNLRRSLSKTIEKEMHGKKVSREIVTPDEIIEYAGKQLGLRG